MASRSVAQPYVSIAAPCGVIAASSFTCASTAAAVMVGLVLSAVFFDWRWAENLATLVLPVWLVGETREAWKDTHAPDVKGAHAAAVLQ